MANEGTASIEIVGDARNFARDTLKMLNDALKKMRPNPIEIPIDTDAVGKTGEEAGEQLAEGVTRGADGRLRDSRGRFLKAGEGAGRAAGDGARRGFLDSFRNMDIGDTLKRSISKAGSLLGDGLKATASGAMTAVGKTLGIALIAAIGTTVAGSLAPTLAAAVTSAAGIGLGAGILGLGAFALREVKPLQKAVKDLGETLSDVGRRAAKPLLGPFMRSIAILKEDLKFLEPTFKSVFRGMAGVVGPLTQAISSFIANALDGIKDSIPGITAAFDGLSRVLPEVGRWLGDFFRTIFGNKDLIDNTTEGLTKLIFGPLKLLGPSISGLNVLFGVWNNALKLLAEGDYFSRLGESILGFVDGGSGAISRITDAWGPLKDAIIRVWDTLKAFAAEDDSKKLETKFQEIVQAIKDAWGPLKDFISRVWTEAMAAIKRLWDEEFVPWWNETAAPWLKEALKAAFEAAWDAAVGVVTGRLDVMRANIWNRLGGIPGLVFNALNPMNGVISAVFRGAVSAANAQLVRMVGNAADFFRRIISQARSILGQLRGAVTGAFAGAGSWLYNAGANVINGLLSGIRAGFGRVRSLLGELTGMLPDWKGPAAVDRRILEPSGRMVMQGLEAGMTREFASIQRTLGGLTSGLAGWAPTRTTGATNTTNMSGLTFNINVSGATGSDAGREAAEQVLQALAQAQLVR